METGILVVEKVRGKSTVTRCFSKYPLKFIVPSKAGCSKTDAVWVYSLTYGGGIVSGDSISCTLTIGDGCTAALTTQASTKVYKSVGSKCCEQFLEVLLEAGSITSIAERMQDYQVVAMIIFLGPKVKPIQNEIQDDVKRMMSESFTVPSSTSRHYMKVNSDMAPSKPAFIASCSTFGPKGIGFVVRIAAVTTESVYKFLKHHLASMEPLLGAAPYR
ncbi:urease accessory protein D isoform X4 [Telopea speciosissima]|uniref:urease accessory protein D isoform X4 n=1 Tax=Telopea speciosissima TaxID=54955 RepID=UPI001CC5C953|nr:urease accessory protein D isoform X4 [Telopea speciosissima]